AQVHVPPVQRSHRGMSIAHGRIRVPEFDGSVDVEDTVVMAPLHDLTTVDVPGQVDEEITFREMTSEQGAQILRGNPVLDEGHAPLEPRLEGRFVRLEVHNGDPQWINLDVVHQNWQRASRDGAEAEKQDAFIEGSHPSSSA